MKQKQILPSPGKDTEQLELSCIAGGNIKWYSHFGKYVVFYKVKHILTIRDSSFIPRYLPRRNDLCSHKNL